jgi:hypothetical protein
MNNLSDTVDFLLVISSTESLVLWLLENLYLGGDGL